MSVSLTNTPNKLENSSGPAVPKGVKITPVMSEGKDKAK